MEVGPHTPTLQCGYRMGRKPTELKNTGHTSLLWAATSRRRSQGQGPTTNGGPASGFTEQPSGCSTP